MQSAPVRISLKCLSFIIGIFCTLAFTTAISSTAFAATYAVCTPSQSSESTSSNASPKTPPLRAQAFAEEETEEIVERAAALMAAPAGANVPPCFLQDSQGRTSEGAPKFESEMAAEIAEKSGISDAINYLTDVSHKDGRFATPDLTQPHMADSIMVKLVDGISEEAAVAELAKMTEYNGLYLDYASLFVGWTSLKCSPDTDLVALISELSNHPQVFADAQPDYVYAAASGQMLSSTRFLSSNIVIENAANSTVKLKSLESAVTAPESTISTNNTPDPDLDWGLSTVRAYEAWDKQKTDRAVTVAVLDSGCDVTHPDLVNNIISTYDATGVVGAGTDPLGHGTHVCGIIAAEADNGEGSAGVSYNAQLLPINIMKCDSSGDWYVSTSAEAGGYAYVISIADFYNIRVMNRSFGAGYAPGTGTMATCGYDQSRAIAAAGILPVTSSGNEYRTYSSGYDHDPSSYNFGFNVINLENSVSGLRRRESSNCNYSGSQYPNNDKDSTHMCTISAPGTDIYSTTSDTDADGTGPTFNDGIPNDYIEKTGTSMATPYVSGVAALVFAANPRLSVSDVKNIIESTARDIVYPADATHNAAGVGYDLETGYGCVDACAAVEEAFARLPQYGDVSDLLKVEFDQDRFDSFVYNSREIKPEINVKLGDRNLQKGVDYSLSYHNNVNAGSNAYVQITGIGNFSGTKRQESFTINRCALKNLYLTVDNVTYVGASTPQPPINQPQTMDSAAFNAGVTKTYKNTDKAGNATVTVAAKANSNFTGEKTLSFKVLPFNFSNASSANISTCNVYNGTKLQPLSSQGSFKLKDPLRTPEGYGQTFNNVTLKAGVDYDVTYSNNLNAGKATYTVKGKGSCSGTLTGTWTINPRDVVLSYNTGTSRRETKVESSDGSTMVSAQSAGPMMSSPAIILGYNTYVYTGKAINPTVRVFVDFPGKERVSLAKGKDFTVSCTNNKNAGTAKAEIKLINKNYCMPDSVSSKYTYKFSFKIQKANNPMTTSIKTKNYTASFKTLKKKAIGITPKYTIKKNQGTVTMKKESGSGRLTVNSKGKITVKKGTKKGTYKVAVSITAKGNSNYKAKTTTYNLKVKVK